MLSDTRETIVLLTNVEFLINPAMKAGDLALKRDHTISERREVVTNSVESAAHVAV